MHLGRGPRERIPGRGALFGAQDQDGDGTPVPGGVHRRRRGGKDLAEGNIQGWMESVNILARVTQKHPQSAYAGLQKSLHQEWAFVQRVTQGVGDAFVPVEDALKETFVPELFKRLREGVRVEEALAAALEGGPVLNARRLRRAAKTGDLLTVQPSTVNGTELGDQEWCDALFLRYGCEDTSIITLH